MASEFAAFAATLEASATANKTTLTQLRALDRFTAQRDLPSGTIDETLAKAWLAGCATRAPNTRRARYYLLRRFCRFLAIDPPIEVRQISARARLLRDAAGDEVLRFDGDDDLAGHLAVEPRDEVLGAAAAEAVQDAQHGRVLRTDVAQQLRQSRLTVALADEHVQGVVAVLTVGQGMAELALELRDQRFDTIAALLHDQDPDVPFGYGPEHGWDRRINHLAVAAACTSQPPTGTATSSSPRHPPEPSTVDRVIAQ